MGRAKNKSTAATVIADQFTGILGTRRGSGRPEHVPDPSTVFGRIELLQMAGITPIIHKSPGRIDVKHPTDNDQVVAVVADGGEVWAYDDVIVYAYGDTEVVLRNRSTAHAYDDVEVSAYSGDADENITIYGFGHSRLQAGSGITAYAKEHCSVTTNGGAIVKASSESYVSIQGELDKVQAREHAVVVTRGGGRIDAGGDTTVYALGDATVRGSGRAHITAADTVKVSVAKNSRCVIDAYGFATIKSRPGTTVNAHGDGVTVTAA